MRLRPYEMVAEKLRARIALGEWQPGQLMPGRRSLAAEYDVASATLERAVGMLIAEGVVSASDRRGTFVSHRHADHGRPIAEPPTVMTAQRALLRATVGIVASVIPYGSPEPEPQWPARILASLEHGLSTERGVTQRFVNLAHNDQPGLTLPQAVDRLVADGSQVVVTIGYPDLEDTLRRCEAAATPLICVEYDPVPLPVPQIYIDNATGGALAARHLRERGYANLTFLRPFSAVWAEARLSGARTATGQHGLRVFPLDAAPLVSMDARDQERAGYAAGTAILQTSFEPGTGLIAPNDSVAMGFIRSAQERGLAPGKDFGIVGFDDWSREANLTSLRPPLEAMGEEGARLVLQILRGESIATRIVLQHRLIARSSTAPAGAGAAILTEEGAS